MSEPTHSDLKADVAALRAMSEEQFKGLNARMGKVEVKQQDLINVAVQGKAGLRVLLWVGGALSAAGAIAVAIWKQG